MNKDSLIKKISKQSGLKKKKSENIFDSVINIISKELGKGKEVSINGFGDFKIVREKMRIKVSKNSMKTVIPPKDVVDFVPAENLLNKINSHE